jgi:pyruvate,orthophosphate dikinase
MEAIKAVFRSWDNPRANVYRRMNDIPGDSGAPRSTYSPWYSATWAIPPAPALPSPATPPPVRRASLVSISSMHRARTSSPASAPRSRSPSWQRICRVLRAVCMKIAQTVWKSTTSDMQDMEFTIEDGTCIFLQTRNGKRTAAGGDEDCLRSGRRGHDQTRRGGHAHVSRNLDQLLHPHVRCRKALKKCQSHRQALAGISGLLSAKSISRRKMPLRSANRGEKRSFWFVWRPLPRISTVCTRRRVF